MLDEAKELTKIPYSQLVDMCVRAHIGEIVARYSGKVLDYARAPLESIPPPALEEKAK